MIIASVHAATDAAGSPVGVQAPGGHRGRLARVVRACTLTRRRRLLGASGVVMAAVGAWASVHRATLARPAAAVRLGAHASASALSGPVVLCLVVVSVLHYVAAAFAARAAAGVRLPFGELFATQFAAAAVNRLVPAGLAGATLLARHVSRRGRIRMSEAIAAVSSIAVVGALADLLTFGALVGLGSVVGVGGARGELPLLTGRLVALVPTPAHVWPVVVVLGVPVVVVAAWLARSRGTAGAERVRAARAAYVRSVRELVRRPSRWAVVLLASGSTTLLLAAGFAAAATLGAGGLPVATFGALMIGYMAAAAAGNAVPTPGGVGAVEVALAGVLVAAGADVASSVGIALAFRFVTFWSPAVVGVALLAVLRRRGAF